MSLFDPFVILQDLDIARRFAITSTVLLDVALLQNVIAIGTYSHFNPPPHNKSRLSDALLGLLEIAYHESFFVLLLVFLYIPVYLTLFKHRDDARAMRYFGHIQAVLVVMQIGGLFTECVDGGYSGRGKGPEKRVMGVLGWYLWPAAAATIPGLVYLSVKYWNKVRVKRYEGLSAPGYGSISS